MTFFKTLLDWLIPENKKIERLLTLEISQMRALLPKSPVNIKNITVLFDYHNKIVRSLIKTLKHKNNVSLRKRLAVYLYEEIIEISSDISLFEGHSPLLVPMPMSKKEKNKKGFNQCEELCKEIAKLSDNKIEVSYLALKKIKETKRQTSLGREERLSNVIGSMQADEQIVKDRVVIVLDDVYTTLATFSEAHRALLTASARSIHGLFLAH